MSGVHVGLPTPLPKPVGGLRRFIPSLGWLRGYQWTKLKSDAAAGVTTAVMLIPQGMAYAMLAGLPPIIGLYASVVPLALYALLGTSRQLAVGPVAMVSLLVAQGVAPLAESGTNAYVAFAVLLALMVGVLQFGMGLFRLGFLVNLLSHPVVSGFTSAAALIIGLSQLKYLLGVSLPRSKNIFAVLGDAFGAFNAWHVATIAITLGSIAILLGLQRWKPAAPRALVVVVVGSLAVWLGGLDRAGVATVQDVPAGLPAPSLPIFDGGAITALFPIALTIALVSFMESISVAKAFARKEHYDVDANQELLALGTANIGGAFFSAYPVTGGFSRTAVNAQAGAKTPLAGLITSAIIAVTLLFFTPLFYYLPNAVLAAIIMTAVFGLVDINEIRHLWQVKRSDLALLVITFVATLSVGIEEGILAGVAASIAFFVFKTSRPHVALLGELPGNPGVYRNLKRYPEAKPLPGVLMVRIDAQFYFANTTFLKETLIRFEREASEPIQAVIIDASSINNLDSSAATALEELYDAYAQRGIRLFIASPKGPVRDVLDRAHLSAKLGDTRLPKTLAEAAAAARPSTRTAKLAPAV